METGKRYSRKRAAIMECLKSTTIHPTAEWIYEQLKPEIPDLSLGDPFTATWLPSKKMAL